MVIDFIKKLKGTKYVQSKDNGNTIVLYIMLFPVVFAAFGLAVDTTVATFTQTSLQSNLDAATQSALSRAVNPGAGADTQYRPYLDPTVTLNNTINIYDFNRVGTKEQPFVQCQTSITTASETTVVSPRLVTPSGSRCGFTLNDFKIDNTYRYSNLEINIVEKSSPIFLRYVGINEFKYNLYSEARITYARG